jgi:hypothetical protein
MEEEQISHSLIILLFMLYTYLPPRTCKSSTVYKLSFITKSVSRQGDTRTLLGCWELTTVSATKLRAQDRRVYSSKIIMLQILHFEDKDQFSLVYNFSIRYPFVVFESFQVANCQFIQWNGKSEGQFQISLQYKNKSL